MDNNLEKKHIGLIIKAINKKMAQRLNRELEKYDLTLMQNEVLLYLHCHRKEHKACQKDIENFLESTNPTVTGLLKRLEAKGLIRRTVDLNDARYKHIELTSKGEEIVCKTLDLGSMTIESRIEEKLTKDQLTQLSEMLDIISEALND